VIPDLDTYRAAKLLVDQHGKRINRRRTCCGLSRGRVEQEGPHHSPANQGPELVERVDE
jgi:hypothetical protein